MKTSYRIRRKHFIMLIVSLLLASSFYFIPLPDRGQQQPAQGEQAQDLLPAPTSNQPRLPDSTVDPASLAGRESAVTPSALAEPTGSNKPALAVESLAPKSVTPSRPQVGTASAPAAPISPTVEHLSTRDFSIPPFSLQDRILPAIHDTHF